MVAELKSEPSRRDSFSSGDLRYQEPNSGVWRFYMNTPVWQPPADIYETADALVVRLEVAGLRENDFAIELNDGRLLVRGSRSDIPERRAYHQMEIRFGEFRFEMDLNVDVLIEQVHAVYANGFLRIILPKPQPR
ncbi:MAG: Hsp20/alpha crystallin family protein [Chloroflexi bacterium]|jgi:HSP20 family protein|nr:Hsp20/alpha crystallin family protein [Chloroflexota bacterium]